MTRRISTLEEKHSRDQAELVQRCTDFEEKYSQSQTELGQVSAALDDANALSSSLHAQLNSEKVIYKTVLCLAVFLLLAWSLRELTFARRKKNVSLLLLVTILTDCIVILATR
jgi:CHASE2 domain-containing sensor protein